MSENLQEESMSDGRATPAGWYPDPSDAAAQRWWNGAQWTEHVAPATPVVPPVAAPVVPPVAAPVAAPQVAAPAYVAPMTSAYAPAYGTAAARVPEGTPVDTIWIWLIVALPVLAVLPIFFWDFESYLEQSMSMSSSSTVLTALGPYTDPWYLALTFGSWIAYGLVVWFAYLDWAALARFGYQRRFHWAWAFLSSLVYVIGRSVVVRRQAGRGMLPMVAAIVVTVLITIGVIVWTVLFMVSVVNASMEMYPAY
jgi:hypothetical protein